MSHLFVTFAVRMHKSLSVKRKDGKYPIVLQITWGRNVRRKRLGIYSLIDQWDFNNDEFKKGVYGRRERNKQIEEIEEKARKVYNAHFDTKPFDYNEFIEMMWEKPRPKIGVAEFCEQVSKNFLKKGQANSAHYYHYTGVAVLKLAPQDMSFSQFTEEWLRKFEDYHISRGVKCFNYMVHLRSIYNKAVEQKIVDFRQNPFKNPYTNPYGYDFSKLKKSKVAKVNKNSY